MHCGTEMMTKARPQVAKVFLLRFFFGRKKERAYVFSSKTLGTRRNRLCRATIHPGSSTQVVPVCRSIAPWILTCSRPVVCSTAIATPSPSSRRAVRRRSDAPHRRTSPSRSQEGCSTAFRRQRSSPHRSTPAGDNDTAARLSTSQLLLRPRADDDAGDPGLGEQIGPSPGQQHQGIRPPRQTMGTETPSRSPISRMAATQAHARSRSTGGQKSNAHPPQRLSSSCRPAPRGLAEPGRDLRHRDSVLIADLPAWPPRRPTHGRAPPAGNRTPPGVTRPALQSQGPNFPESSPPASGLHTISPTPSDCSRGTISRSMSRPAIE